MKNYIIYALAAITAFSTYAVQYKISGDTNKPDALYGNGEEIVFNLLLTADGAPTSMPVRTSLKIPGQVAPIVEDRVADKSGKILIKASPKIPGWVLLEANVLNNKMKPMPVKVQVGAIYMPDEIKAALPPPDDFKSFWDKELDALKKLPLDVKLRPVQIPEKSNPDGKIFGAEFSINCVGPTPSTGYIAKPIDAKPKSLPIIVGFQGASGIRAWKPWYYGDVAISVTTSKFGLPNELTDEEYAALGYKNSNAIYEMSKESATNICDNVFKWMILRDMRAIQYAKSLPEWDGKTLIVNGESLGGGQSIACGALDPDVTLICACVPALSDHNGRLAGRHNGWPQLWKCDQDGKPVDEGNAKISQTSRYIDNVNFLSIVTPGKEVTIGTGFIDTTCPPEGVYAAFNALSTNVVRNLWTNPKAGHGAGNAHGGQRIATILGK